MLRTDPSTLNEFEKGMAERHGWPLEEFHRSLRREQLKNWYPKYKARQDRLRKRLALMFCPRCAAPLAWDDADKKDYWDTTPISQDHIWCGDCDETFEIRSIPGPYSHHNGFLPGWEKRRKMLVAEKIARYRARMK